MSDEQLFGNPIAGLIFQMVSEGRYLAERTEALLGNDQQAFIISRPELARMQVALFSLAETLQREYETSQQVLERLDKLLIHHGIDISKDKDHND